MIASASERVGLFAAMPNYRVYSLDGQGSISLAEWLEADDDQDAVTKVRHLKRQTLKCEVWKHGRLVAVLNARDLAD